MAIWNREKEDAPQAQSPQTFTPRATAFDVIARILRNRPDAAMQGGNVRNDEMKKIGPAQIDKAYEILQKYKASKTNLEQKIIDNEKWFKLRHWECMRDQEQDVQPVSAWLFNCIANKHADAMDNFPSPNILPREESDKAEAKVLSSIIPVILDQCDFEATYDNVAYYKLKTGTGVYGVFWDKSKLHGLGDISIKKIDLLNLFWEGGITDIQNSPNLFHVELVNNEYLVNAFPRLKDKLTTATVEVAHYVYDDTVDTSEKSAVIDWYYKKNQNGRTVLHYCKFVNDEVLFATENETAPFMDEDTGEIIAPPMAETGLYNDGEYPFVFDPLFPLAGTPCGFGYIDIGKDAQSYIDRGNQAILQNMLANARPRYFIRDDGSVNEAEFADFTKTFVHVKGSNLGQDSLMPIESTGLGSIFVEIINNKIDELKETTGNRDISTGGTSGGVTAASGIAAMQEAGSKLSRDDNKAAYRAFRKIVLMIIERIRQFYDTERYFRIVGENGAAEFIAYTNKNIVEQSQGGIEYDVDMGHRLPLFDVEVSAQKQSPYSKMAQNELALQFYSAGFFNPQLADQALACLDMMDFDRKDFIIQKISLNGGMYQQMMAMQQQMLMLAQIVDKEKGSNIAVQLAAQFNGGAPTAINSSISRDAQSNEALGAETGKGDTKATKEARQRVADSTSPT